MINGLRLGGERNWGLILLWIYTYEETSQERHGKQQSLGSKDQTQPGSSQGGSGQFKQALG